MNQRASRKAVTTPAQSQGDDVDRAGDGIIALLQQAADLAKQDSETAYAMAHQISLQLRAAEDRADELLAQNNALQDQVRKAEHWFSHIQSAIAGKFLQQDKSKSQPG